MVDVSWILLVLVAAMAHAGWNALVKSGTNPTISFALVIGTGAIIGTCALPFVGDVGPDGWKYVLVSSAIHCAYYAVLLAAYAKGDLSHVYPIARGLGPVLVAFGSFLANERLGPLEWLGLGFVAAGLLLPDGNPRRLYGEAGLVRALGELVAEDGGTLSRRVHGLLGASFMYSRTSCRVCRRRSSSLMGR